MLAIMCFFQWEVQHWTSKLNFQISSKHPGFCECKMFSCHLLFFPFHINRLIEASSVAWSGLTWHTQPTNPLRKRHFFFRLFFFFKQKNENLHNEDFFILTWKTVFSCSKKRFLGKTKFYKQKQFLVIIKN